MCGGKRRDDEPQAASHGWLPSATRLARCKPHSPARHHPRGAACVRQCLHTAACVWQHRRARVRVAAGAACRRPACRRAVRRRWPRSSPRRRRRCWHRARWRSAPTAARGAASAARPVRVLASRATAGRRARSAPAPAPPGRRRRAAAAAARLTRARVASAPTLAPASATRACAPACRALQARPARPVRARWGRGATAVRAQRRAAGGGGGASPSHAHPPAARARSELPSRL